MLPHPCRFEEFPFTHFKSSSVSSRVHRTLSFTRRHVGAHTKPNIEISLRAFPRFLQIPREDVVLESQNGFRDTLKQRTKEARKSNVCMIPFPPVPREFVM
jgi:hypothetical protein